jgi:TPR repeat protein
VKSLFYRQEELQNSDELIRILNTNYRNSQQVTDIANKILKIKNQRFGSIDKESHYLVECNSHNQGEVLFLQNTAANRQELDNKTKASTLFAVIVMTTDQKPEAQQHFSTPLVFTIQEAKGLEYENIILYNFLSQEEACYREISKGVSAADLEQDMKYARGKDKTDKSLEIYKFYINALYVAITRAAKNLYWIESSPRQPLLDLLGLRDAQFSLQLASQNSSIDAWRQEAHKLELQGKQEQADRIRSEILKQKIPDWQVITGATLDDLKRKALEGNDKNARMTLFEYGLVYKDHDIINSLLKIDFKAAKHPEKGLQILQQKHFRAYSFKKPDAVLKQVDQYGLDFRNIFNQTPLMVAACMGNAEVMRVLLDLGADSKKTDNNGLTASQIVLTQEYQNKSYPNMKDDKKDAFNDCNRKAADDANASYHKGHSYLNGQGVKQDSKKAVLWFRKAAEQGHSMAQSNLGVMYCQGLGVQQNYQQAMQWYLKAAEQCNANAQACLGRMYIEGNGVQQDYYQAEQWFRMATEQGNAIGQYYLGIMYIEGLGVQQDYYQAEQWFRKAAEQGYERAQCNLGSMYAKGLGVQQDNQQAMRWLRKAAAQGHVEAKIALTIMTKMV